MQRLPKPVASASRRRLLAARAQGLRAAPTVSEQKLWAALSGGQLGVAFRRQVPVGHGCIVDFLAPSLKLVVEVDGSAHAHRRRADARRDEKLQRAGYRVLRFAAEDVVRDVGRVARLVRQAVAQGAGQ